MVDSVKVALYKTLGLKNYLKLLQKLFITGYTTGILKQSEKYKWHYFVKKIISPSDTIIDIGANLGYFSYIFSRIINSNGNLYSVEPVKPYRDLLVKILPDKPNITVYPFALGDRNGGPVKLGMPPLLRHLQYLRHGTVTILNNDSISNNQLIFESEVRKGSEVFSGLYNIDYIKCDIEGYETVVFPEMRPILEKHRPLVQLETWGEQLPVMLSFFKGLDYKGYHLKGQKLKRCDHLSPGEAGSSDILFVPEKKAARVKDFLN